MKRINTGNAFLTWTKWGNAVFPFFLYFVLINTAFFIGQVLLAVLNIDYTSHYMMVQTGACLVTLPFIYVIYKRDRAESMGYHKTLKEEFDHIPKKSKILQGMELFFCGALAGIFLNNVIGMTGLKESSQSFQEVTNNFFSGSMLFEITAACILVPLLEELLHRGIIYSRMRELCDKKTAVFLSAFLFGLSHFNLVQFIYAGLLGILLAVFTDQYKHYFGAFLAHAGANTISVLRMNTNLFQWMESGERTFLLSTVAAGILCVLLLILIYKRNIPLKKG